MYKRQVSNIRLLDIANRIIGKYRGLCGDGRIFPVPHYNTCLAGIRAVAKRCGITKQEQDMLRAGLPVRDKLIERKDGRKFVTTLQVNVEQRGVEFVPGTGRSPRAAQAQEAKNNPAQGQAQGTENTANTNKEQRRNTWTNADGSIRPISKWSGVDFTEQQKADYVAGKAVKLENVTDKQGFHATMYIRFNPEKGRPYRYATNPDNAQKVAPSNESRTQVPRWAPIK